MGNAASNFFVADNKKQAANDFLDEKLVNRPLSDAAQCVIVSGWLTFVACAVGRAAKGRA